jgi:hypothetical protein
MKKGKKEKEKGGDKEKEKRERRIRKTEETRKRGRRERRWKRREEVVISGEEKKEGTLLWSTATPAVLRWVLIGATWLHCRVVVSNLGRYGAIQIKSSATLSFHRGTSESSAEGQESAPHLSTVLR